MTAQPINKISRNDVALFEELGLIDFYQEVAVKSAIYPGQGTPFGVMYCALGLGEAGEVQNKVKKMFRDDGAVLFEPHGDFTATYFENVTPERKRAIMKEMGGNLWYLAALAQELGTTLSEIALLNLEELCSRGERNTLSGDGDDR